MDIIYACCKYPQEFVLRSRIRKSGTINYVRREGRYVLKYYLNMAAPIGLSTVTSNMEELEFLSSFIHAFC